MTTAEEVEDNLSQRMEKSEEELEEEEEGPGSLRCRSKYWAHECQRGEPCQILED